MTNRIALALALLILTALILDRVAFGGAAFHVLARRFVALIDWVAFWR
jgi:hypothetical protein